MGWLRKRFGEKSTARGTALLTSILSIYFGPEIAPLILTGLGTLYGAYEIIKSENSSD